MKIVFCTLKGKVDLSVNSQKNPFKPFYEKVARRTMEKILPESALGDG